MRKLSVVCIDDKANNQSEFRKYSHLFENSSVRGMADARLAILEARNAPGRRPPIDLFLIDVDMRDNTTDHEDYDFGDGSAGRKPYGPVLALPYMTVRPTTQFVPYSLYWGDPTVHDNG